MKNNSIMKCCVCNNENFDGHFINYDELIDKMQEIEGSDNK